MSRRSIINRTTVPIAGLVLSLCCTVGSVIEMSYTKSKDETNENTIGGFVAIGGLVGMMVFGMWFLVDCNNCRNEDYSRPASEPLSEASSLLEVSVVKTNKKTTNFKNPSYDEPPAYGAMR